MEELDNGIHPARVSALINRLGELGKSRGVDIILTTHNPILLNKYDKEKLLGVSIVYRDQEKGISQFIPFVEIEQYPKLLAKGGLGEAYSVVNAGESHKVSGVFEKDGRGRSTLDAIWSRAYKRRFNYEATEK